MVMTVMVVVLTCMAQVYRLVLDPNQFSPSAVGGGTNSSIKAGALVTNLYYNNGSIGSPSVSAAAHTNLGINWGTHVVNLSAANTASDYGLLQADTNGVLIQVVKASAGSSFISGANGTNWVLSVSDMVNPTVQFIHDLQGFHITDATIERFLLNTNGQFKYTAFTPAAVTVTNCILDFQYSDLDLTLTSTTAIQLLQSTNRPAAGRVSVLTFRIFANGANVTISTNSALAWRTLTGATFPVTVTNGDWGVVNLVSYGPSETNTAVGYNYFH